MNTLFITGAGGSVGQSLIKYFLSNNPKIRIKALERSEMAMAELLALYGNNQRVKPILADLLDFKGLQHELQGCDAVIHCAALKHVIIGKFYPERQAYENVTAFYNIISAAKAAGVPKFIFCSTDKAAQPTGVMGASKHLLEFICRDSATPTFNTATVRFANIIGSNGSLLRVIDSRIKDGADIVLRDERMTRFFLRQENAIALIDYALNHAHLGEIFVRDTPAARIKDVMEVVLEARNIPLSRIKPSREKIFENLYERLVAPEEIEHTRIVDEVYFTVGGQKGAELSRLDAKRALSSSNGTIDKQAIKELIYGK
ncbi:MAG TPA: polysaccharide biosynthesis protein [Candidatus Saccharimonadales bacterium]|nr:polysaccharide biosynthesis protein [Candidatus Saccharimonadales bacterium]